FLAYMEKKASEKKQPPPKPQTFGNSIKSSPSTPPKSSTTPVQSPTVTTSKPGSSKKTANQPKSIDDFVPEETIDSTFLDETDKGEVKKTTAGRSDTSDDSDSEKGGNPMVSGFQDISSEDELEDNVEITTTQKASEAPQNTSFDVDIDLTSDESEEETGVGDVVSPMLHSDDDSNDSEKITEPAKPVVLKTKYDVVLNDEDNNFMDAWLDSPSTDPREVSVKSRKRDDKNISTLNTNDLDMFEASQLTSKSSSNTQATVDENSSSGVEEEKKKSHSEKKQSKEGEEGKHRHRSKNKHKKKSKTKESEDGVTESSEKKHKSKKKSRQKNGKTREKAEGTGADYESF
ncbi:Hypothetical predicted protein, partial [Paramuricea clavata]